MANQMTKTLVFDPITFKGGSKIATSDALNVCRETSNNFIVLTVDPDYWQQTEFYANHKVSVLKIPTIGWLMEKHTGLLYWLNQVYLLCVLIKTILSHGSIDKAIGASGPGIDMPLYLLKTIKEIEIIQFVHGNVGLSRSIGYCLTIADAVFYLPSAKLSIKLALDAYLQHTTKIDDTTALAEHYISGARYQSFLNGIPASRWPSRCQQSLPVLFWAASLLKWKGLDTLVDAVKLASHHKPLALNVCYIHPIDTCLPISTAPVLLKHTEWHEDPANLDEIRSQSNIFVSTSYHEPFGLSILEALAAGMCVVIPRDGSFWDQQLTHNENCIKYEPGDSESLSNALLYATNDYQVLKRCCSNAISVSTDYQADSRYDKLAQRINSDVVTSIIGVYD